jgi:hypothetical protein
MLRVPGTNCEDEMLLVALKMIRLELWTSIQGIRGLMALAELE